MVAPSISSTCAALVAGASALREPQRRASRSTPASSATARPAIALGALCAPSSCSVKSPSRSPARNRTCKPLRSSAAVKNLRIGAWAGAKIHHAASKIAAKLRHVRIVAVQKSHAVRGQRSHQLKLGARNAGLAIGKILNVRRAHVRHHAPIGRGNARQRGNLARVVHAHLDHRESRAPVRGATIAAAGRMRCSDCRAT